jgi:hypothetical protein
MRRLLGTTPTSSSIAVGGPSPGNSDNGGDGTRLGLIEAEGFVTDCLSLRTPRRPSNHSSKPGGGFLVTNLRS